MDRIEYVLQAGKMEIDLLQDSENKTILYAKIFD